MYKMINIFVLTYITGSIIILYTTFKFRDILNNNVNYIENKDYFDICFI